MTFSLIYIVDFGKLEWQSVCLAASIRAFVRDRDMRVIAYCPAHRIDRLENVTREVHEKLSIEIRPLDTTSEFNPGYPHGNKILACAAPREDDHCIFMDTDMIFLRSTFLQDILHPGGFAAVRETNARWPQNKEMWGRVYSALDHPVARGLSVFSNRVVAPSYYNAGFVAFDDRPIAATGGKRFGELWRDLAYRVDKDDEIAEKRPFLDQITLPAAADSSGLHIRELSAEYNTQIRFEEADGDGTRVLHYHSNMFGNLLKESKYFNILNQILSYYDISENFVELVKKYQGFLAHPGVGNVLEFPTSQGIAQGHLVMRCDIGQVVEIYMCGYNFSESGPNPEFRGGFGIIDLPAALVEKNARIIGQRQIEREQQAGVAFRMPNPDGQGGEIFWNGRGNRPAEAPDMPLSSLAERKLDSVHEFLRRCLGLPD